MSRPERIEERWDKLPAYVQHYIAKLEGQVEDARNALPTPDPKARIVVSRYSENRITHGDGRHVTFFLQEPRDGFSDIPMGRSVTVKILDDRKSIQLYAEDGKMRITPEASNVVTVEVDPRG